MPMVVNCAVYENGRRVADLTLDELKDRPRKPGSFVWVGLHEPDEETLSTVQQAFNLHPLAVEDAHRAHQRPKLEQYGDDIFLVLRTAHLGKDNKRELGETHVFAGRGYVVTVRHGASSSYALVRARCEAAPALLKHGEDYVLYSIIDFVIDNYMPLAECLEDAATQVEEQVLSQTAGRETVAQVYRLKKEIMEVRRSVVPVIDMAARLMRPDNPLVDPNIRPYFRDVQDHAIRVVENLDNVRDLLTAAVDAGFAYLSMTQNDVMRRLGAWAAILAVPTAIAGIYGMNFEVMPELRMTFGYPTVVATILVICVVLYRMFRKRGWL
ncbi:magnesium/cobalt transporter CorA [Lacibacterium aquatile]|uniref:Magnesium transport protein CorA n=1 Tax=Lacibacterium aquatile TaxID=1168082 RepID=A0ABW5DNM2_9PROT